jgi:hypothetical protein
VIDDVFGSETKTGSFYDGVWDLKSMSLIISHIRGSPTVRQAFDVTARELDESDLEFVAANLTRWEGRVAALDRFLLLKNQLQRLHQIWIKQRYLS